MVCSRGWRQGPTVCILSYLAFSSWIIGLRAATQCEIIFVASPENRDQAPKDVTITCTGESVAFTVGSEVNVTVRQGNTAEITILDKYDYGNPHYSIELESGNDVTFSRVEFRNFRYNPENQALIIRSCNNCRLQNVTVDNVELAPGEDASFIRIEDSSVTIDGAQFTNLIDTPASVVSAVNSNVTLQSVRVAGSTMAADLGGLVDVTGGSLVAGNCTFEDLAFNFYAVSVIHVTQSAETAGTVQLDNVTLINLTDLAIPALDISDTGILIQNSKFLFISAVGVPSAAVLSVQSQSVTVAGCTFSDIKWSWWDHPMKSTESSVLTVDGNATLRVVNSNFTDIGGCGTAVRARGWSSSLEISGVNMADINLQGDGERRATVVVDGANSSLVATNCTWRDIDVGNSNSGAAVAVLSSGNVTLTGCNFSDINSPNVPAVQFLGSGGPISLANCTWSQVTSAAALKFDRTYGAVALEGLNVTSFGNKDSDSSVIKFWNCLNGTTPVIQASNFRSNSAAHGGALQLSGCTVQVLDSHFEANKAAKSGGAAYAEQESGLHFDRCTFLSNEAGSSGGAVFARGQSSVQFRSCFFSGNTVLNGGGLGGGVFGKDATLSFLDITFTQNSVYGSGAEGGALSCINCNVTAKDSVFTSNSAPAAGGGAISLDVSRVGLDSCTFTANSAGAGGAVISKNTTLTISNSSFSRNTADGGKATGGAVSCWGGLATVNASTFFANSAGSFYGGAFSLSRAALTLQGSILLGNTAAYGAGIFIDGAGADVNPVSSNITRFLSSDGGGPPVLPDPEVFGERSSALVNSSLVQIIGTSFTQNVCPDGDISSSAGGAVYGARQLYVYKSTFIRNSCPTGGAIAVLRGGVGESVVIAHSIFRWNRATSNGGAVALIINQGQTAYAIIHDNTFTNNAAATRGGAIMAVGGWAMYFRTNLFSGNGLDGTGLTGGAIFAENCRNLPGEQPTTSNVYMQLNNFTGNTAQRAGAWYANSCNITVIGDRFIGNSAAEDGGALYAINIQQTPPSFLQMREIHIEANTAHQAGGALLVHGEGLELSNATFTGNQARITGGAIMVFEASPAALRVLQRKTLPYYSPEEYRFFRVNITNSTFAANTANSGGGAIYMESSRVIVQRSSFIKNSAGDTFPNDDWSDSGGAIFAATCFDLSIIEDSTFDDNIASGGPGGAVLLAACSAQLSVCNFTNNTATTSGGAVASGNWRDANSGWINTPNLLFKHCNFTGNKAVLNGGAVLARDVNSSVLLSDLRHNRAGGRGGAVAFLNNLGSNLFGSTFEDNTAALEGGAAYLLTTPIVSVVLSVFRRNSASEAGGALSVVQCNCTMSASTAFEGNWVGGRGGALRLHPVSEVSNGFADSGQCAGTFLREVNLYMSPRGREALGTVQYPVESYNATVVYDGSDLGFNTLGPFIRGGVLLPVPFASGTAKFFGYDATVALGNGSSISFAPGSTLAYANWLNFQLLCDLNGTRLANTHDSSYITLPNEASVTLTAGSILIALTQGMSTPPGGSALVVSGNTWRSGNTVYEIGGETTALSLVLAAGSVVQLADGKASSVRIVGWNRFVVWTSRMATVLCDAATGDTYYLGSVAAASVAGGSALLRHSSASTALLSALDVKVQSGAWLLSNGSTLTLGGTAIMLAAVPSNMSSLKAANDSALTVTDWTSYYLKLSGGGLSVQHAALQEAASSLSAGTTVELTSGSAFSVLQDGVDVLPGGVMITVKGALWEFSTGDFAGKGNMPISLVAPPGSVVQLASGDVPAQDWNRYLLWSGPLGSFMYDLALGTVTPLPDATRIHLVRTSPMTWYDSSAVLYGNINFTVAAYGWLLSNGTTLIVAGSKVALTAIPSYGSTITFSNQTTLTVDEWYSYMLVATWNGTLLYDTLSGSAIALGEGAVVLLDQASVMLAHDSFTTVINSSVSCSVQDSALETDSCSATFLGTGNVQQAIVYPATGSKVTFTQGIMLGNIGTGRHVAWASKNGTRLYDVVLGTTYQLAEGSVFNFLTGSCLLEQNSATTVLEAEAAMTLQTGLWQFGDGTSYRVAGNVWALSAVPATLSRISFAAPWMLRATGNDAYSMWAGSAATMLTDTLRQASYTLAKGSVVSLAINSVISFRNAGKWVLGSDINMMVQDRAWSLGGAETLDPGNGLGNRSDAPIFLHTPSIRRLEGELGRTCAADFSSATYQANPYNYSYANLQAFLYGLDASAYSQGNISPRVAGASYGYGVSTEASGFNASLHLPGLPSEAWDLAGRMSSAVVTCTATVAPPAASYAYSLNTMLLNLTFNDNWADEKAGALCLDGGRGHVLLDGLQLSNNTAVNGDGGGFALFQGSSPEFMSLEVIVTSSNFIANTASLGSGGGVSLGGSNFHQQATFINTTIHGNSAAFGGGLALSGLISVKLENSTVSNNVCQPPTLAAALDQNWGNGGGIMASNCNELQLNSGTRLYNNTAGRRGGGLSSISCAVTLLNDTTVESNKAASAGGVHFWNDLPASKPYSSTGNPTGASIAIVVKSRILSNTATGADATDSTLEGIGGGLLIRGHSSTLLANSSFEGNVATVQGGSIFIESQCDLDENSDFLAHYMLQPTVFTSALTLFNGTIRSLQWPRPKGCWGTVVYLPRFVNNEAVRSGGALFASHPEAISLVCGNGNGSDASTANLAINFLTFDEATLAQHVLDAMKMASYQVLDNRIIVQSCYKEEIQRIYNKSIDQLGISGSQLSTLDLSDNRAQGYGYLIAIVPSKLRIVNVTWSGNTTNLALSSPGLDGTLTTNPDLVLGRRRLAALVVGDSKLRPISMTDSPLFNSALDWVYDNDTQGYRQIVNYHITTYSNKPMDMPILLLDALDQVASENTTLRQAQVRAQLLNSSNGCRAELLGGIEAVARNGTAAITAFRLRAPKGDNYSVEFRMEDSIFAGTVEPLVVNITVPPCSIGEVPRDDGFVCQMCDPRSFSLWQDTQPLVNCSYVDQSNITCLPCPDDADCLGGAVIVPRPGFWHSAANSTLMNACPNADACRDGDDTAQDELVACQQRWYSRPQGFDYQAYVDSVKRGYSLSSEWDLGYINVSDPSVCVLWGLPDNNPASYMKKQCADGYSGNLCAVCTPVDGKLYANEGDFTCGECFSQATSITIAALGFVANVMTVMVTIFLTFKTDYTEDEELAIGDLLRVLIVHMQFFVIVTRLNIDWPDSVSFITSLMSACTGAVSKVYSPACLLDVNATPSEAAEVVQLAALVTPLLCVLCIAALWMVFRLTLFNFEAAAAQEPLDMRSVDEYRADRARRMAAKHRNVFKIEVEGEPEDEDGGIVPFDGVGDDYDEALDLHASTLLTSVAAALPRSMRRAGSSKRNHANSSGSGADNLVPHVSLAIKEDDAAETAAERGSGGRAAAAGSGAPLPFDTAAVVKQVKNDMPPPPAVPPPPPPAPAPPGPPVLEKPPGGGKCEEGSSGGGLCEPQPRPGPQPQPQPQPEQSDARTASATNATTTIGTAAVVAVEAAGVRTRAAGDLDVPSTPSTSTTASQTRTPPSWTAALASSSPSALPLSSAAPLPSPFMTDMLNAAPSVVPSGTENGRESESGRASDSTSAARAGGGPAEDAAAAAALTPVGAGRGEATTATPNATTSTAGGGLGAAAASAGAPGSMPTPFATSTSIPAARCLRSIRSHVSFGEVVSGPDREPSALGPTLSKSRNHSSGRKSLEAGARLLTSDGSLRSPAAAAGATAGDAGDPTSQPPPRPSQSCSLGTSTWLHGKRGSLGVGSRYRSGLGISQMAADEVASDGAGANAGAGGGAGCGGGGGRDGHGRDGSVSDCSTHEPLPLSSKGSGRAPSKAGSWLRSFFTYDEEGSGEGQARWASLATIHRTMAWWRQELLVVMIACFVLYPAWAQAALQIFACYTLDDGSGYYPEYQLAKWNHGYWLLNMNQECYTGEHARVWLPIGITCIIVICIGIPFLTFMVTWTHRTALRTVHVVQTYGFLYLRYNYETFYWWEAAIQAQTLVLVVVDVFGRVLVVYQQAMLLLLALILIMWSNMYFQPLQHKLLERMSSLSLVVLSVTVALGLFFVAPSDRKDPVSEVAAATIGGIIIALNLGILIYFFYVMWSHGRETINRKVALARRHVITATSLVHRGLSVMGQRVSMGAYQIRSMTSQSVSTLYRVQVMRRRTSGGLPASPRPADAP